MKKNKVIENFVFTSVDKMLANSKDNAMFGKIKDPVREVLIALTGKKPPKFVKGYNFKNLTDEQVSELQDWCVDHVKPTWACGISLMDAAELFVEEAVGNANIQKEFNEEDD